MKHLFPYLFSLSLFFMYGGKSSIAYGDGLPVVSSQFSSQAKEFLKALANRNTEYLKSPQTQLEKLSENVEKKDNLGLFHLMAMPKYEKGKSEAPVHGLYQFVETNVMEEFAKALIEKKIDINKSFQKESALHHAVAYRNHGAAKIFLKNGIKDSPDQNEKTALEKAILNKDKRMVEILLPFAESIDTSHFYKEALKKEAFEVAYMIVNLIENEKNKSLYQTHLLNEVKKTKARFFKKGNFGAAESVKVIEMTDVESKLSEAKAGSFLNQCRAFFFRF